jgi:hypothetical protein
MVLVEGVGIGVVADKNLHVDAVVLANANANVDQMMH